MGTTRDGRAQRRIRNNSRAISGSEREGGERERGFKTGNQEFWEKTEETKKKWVTEEISLQY